MSNNEPDLEKLKSAETPTRRVKMLMVNPADFMYLFTKGLKVRKGFQLIDGIPDDAVLIQVAADPVRYGIMLVVESESYEPVPVSVMPPVELVGIQLGKGNTKEMVKKPAVRRKK